MAERVTPFDGLTIRFDDDVLEPRPWTVEQARWAADLAEELPAGPVLELCAGAGHIGLAVGMRTRRPLVQVDVDERACELARANAAAADLPSDVRCGRPDRVLRRHERFPLVLADPPYIPSAATARFDGDPELAIDGGDDGLAVARECMAAIARHLDLGGEAVVQLGGPQQASVLAHEATSYGLEEVERRTYGPDRSLVRLRRR